MVDPSSTALGEAHADGLAVVTGDATRREVLRRAGVAQARQVIITTDRDDSTVLATLNVRQLNPDTYVVAAVRESDNVQLVRQSGADSVVTSSDAVGRLLGLSSLSPTLGSVMEDLMTYGEGLEVAERDLLVQEVGKQPQALPDQVIAVVRDGVVHRYFDPAVTQLVRGDRLVVVRPAEELPWAPRPGTHGESWSPTRRSRSLPAGQRLFRGRGHGHRPADTGEREHPQHTLVGADDPQSAAQPGGLLPGADDHAEPGGVDEVHLPQVQHQPRAARREDVAEGLTQSRGTGQVDLALRGDDPGLPIGGAPNVYPHVMPGQM